MALHKFLKEVGVAPQPEIKRVVCEHSTHGGVFRLRAVLPPHGPALNHVVEQTAPPA